MTKQELEKRFEEIFKVYTEQVHQEIVNAVNDYRESNNIQEGEGISPLFLDKFYDYLCLDGAWIYDRLSGYQGFVDSPTYKKSMAKKIRKALGYNL